MYIVLSDLEGVYIPEIWMKISERTGIDELALTTRDVPDFHELMTMRMSILKENGIGIDDISNIVRGIDPYTGASDTIDWIRQRTPFIIISDTFEEFAMPLMARFGYPTLICNSLKIGNGNLIDDYIVRLKGGKGMVAESLKGIGCDIIAFGDSYNDIPMIKAANFGFLYKPSAQVRNSFPDIPVISDYSSLKSELSKYILNISHGEYIDRKDIEPTKYNEPMGNTGAMENRMK